MEQINLNIITPCLRPENLNTVQDSILKANDKVKEIFKIIWYIIFDHDGTFYPSNTLKALYDNPYAFMRPYVKIVDGKVVHAWGNAQRNYALSLIESGWVHFLDDDTIMPENYLDNLEQAFKWNPLAKAIVFDQCDPNDRVLYKASLENLRVDKVGSPQVIFDRKLIGETKWNEELYNADGMFIEEIYTRNPEVFQITDGFVYYNYLRPEAK